MNVSREPFDVEIDRKTVDRQYVFRNSAARFEGECMRNSARDPSGVGSFVSACTSSNVKSSFDYLQ